MGLCSMFFLDFSQFFTIFPHPHFFPVDRRYSYAITLPTEISAASIIISYWDPSQTINPAVWISIMLVMVWFVNFCGVRWYGEAECESLRVVCGALSVDSNTYRSCIAFSFSDHETSPVFLSAVKIVTIIGLIILMLCIDLGAGPRSDRIGFRYWKGEATILAHEQRRATKAGTCDSHLFRVALQIRDVWRSCFGPRILRLASLRGAFQAQKVAS